MVQKDKLAIFDLDGTLFDTKDVNYSAYCEALEKCGFYSQIDYKYYCNFCNGSSYQVFLPQIVPGITKEQIQAVHRMKIGLYPTYLGLALINEHLFSVIDLISKDYYIALVTTASRQNTEDILQAFEVREKFDFIITKEDVINTKPDPEGFLLAMRRFSVSAKNTLIFEDSDVGILAAQNLERGGVKYVRVYGYN